VGYGAVGAITRELSVLDVTRGVGRSEDLSVLGRGADAEVHTETGRQMSTHEVDVRCRLNANEMVSTCMRGRKTQGGDRR
jgi:hypothetical protein